MTGKGTTLQGVLKDASGREIATLKGDVEDILDLEHKAGRMNDGILNVVPVNWDVCRQR